MSEGKHIMTLRVETETYEKVRLLAFQTRKPIHFHLRASIKDYMERVENRGSNLCVWKEYNPDGPTPNCWDTECGQMHAMTEGGLKDNNHVYCTYCGRRIQEHKFIPKWQPRDDDPA